TGKRPTVPAPGFCLTHRTSRRSNSRVCCTDGTLARHLRGSHLGPVVLLSTFLSYSLEVEIERRWHWRRGGGRGRSAAALAPSRTGSSAPDHGTCPEAARRVELRATRRP